MKQAQTGIHPGPELPPLEMAEGLPAPDTLAPASHQPDARVCVTSSGGAVIAHAALWWSNTPALNGQKTGCVGGFAATDARSTRLLLDTATDRLLQEGCRAVVGPMNGNTWRSYRFVVESDGRGPFLLEPRNHPDYPGWWLDAGFKELAGYSSSLVDPGAAPTATVALRERFARSGLVIREFDCGRFEEELRLLHEMCLRSFANNFLYTPLPLDSFLASYQGVRERIDPRFVRIATREQVACGFVFAIPDLEAEARSENPLLVVKTLAVDAASRCAGLGSLLIDEVHAAAAAADFTGAIHALQHDTNTSRKITARHHGTIFRRYALFSKVP